VPDIKLVSRNGKEQEIHDVSELEKRVREGKAAAIRINGQSADLNRISSLKDSDTVEIIPLDSEEGKEIYRHSTSHVMAYAVKTLFPDVRIAIGPSIQEGFYYDFDIDRTFTPDDLVAIEKEMQAIILRNPPFIRKEMAKSEARSLFEKFGEPYKVELLDAFEDEAVTVYELDGFIDLCRGPHLESAGRITAYKLLSVAGAYWKGDENNKMLQRIYGTSFSKASDLKKYLLFLEEVKKRDHRRLGKELDLFSVNDEIGAGLILWHPKGSVIRKSIEDFWRNEHLLADYQLLYTPHIAKLKLWEKSGHWDFYRENMYAPMDIDNIAYEVKPMNCPFHIAVYKTSLRSYREFPVRYAELGTVYRYEKSGVLHGLLRVRGFTQDDAHIFCREDQIEGEILHVLDFTLSVLKTFGFDDYNIFLSTMPEKYVGSLEIWEHSTNALKMALNERKLAYEIDPGAGVFYGPKIDIKVKDSLGRQWQCSTIQVDFNNPERFDMTFRGSDGKEHRPIMIHRALMGSLERFIGVLIEHYAGAFPLWLSPVQLSVLTIADRHEAYAQTMVNELKQRGIRVELDAENEKIGNKIRKSTVRKIPYAVIIGDKEISEKSVMLRKRNGENIGPFTLEGLISHLQDEINSRKP
jgi:threonyl-tRNA synthetase